MPKLIGNIALFAMQHPGIEKSLLRRKLFYDIDNSNDMPIVIFHHRQTHLSTSSESILSVLSFQVPT